MALPTRPGAVIANPSLPALFVTEYRYRTRAGAGILLSDPDDLIGGIDAFQDARLIDRVDSSVAALEGQLEAFDPDTVTVDDLEAGLAAFETVIDDIDRLNQELQQLSGRVAEAELGAWASQSASLDDGVLAVHVRRWAAVGAQARYRDGELIDTVVRDLRTCIDQIRLEELCQVEDLELVRIDNGEPELNFDPDRRLESTIRARGIDVLTVGISLARARKLSSGRIAFGATLKLRQVDVIDYEETFDRTSFSDLRQDRFRSREHDPNLDLGVSMAFDGGLFAGLAVRNLFPARFETRIGNVIESHPQARTGVALVGQRHRLTADLDLTENPPVSFGTRTRFLSLGGDYDVNRWLQLRGGYRLNLSQSRRDLASLGLGLAPARHVRIDLGLAHGRGEKAIGIGLTASF